MAKYCYFFKKSFFLRPQVRIFCSTVLDQPKSSLYISGKRAVDTFVVVVPHLDFDERFQNLQGLKENIKRRKLNLNIDELQNSWDFFKDWNNKRSKLQSNLDEIGRRMKELHKKEGNENKNEIKNLERMRDIIKSELHVVKENVWEIEDNVVGNLLQLPNYLHPEAPEKEEDILCLDEEFGTMRLDHLDNGTKLNLLEYYNPYTCFLKNDAAVFELATVEFCVHHFLEKGFIQFSNPDFTRGALAEGVGVFPNNTSELFLLENTEGNNDRLQLCGGASIFPFCGFHAKHVVKKGCLPVRSITSGRHYSPSTSSFPGLYSLHQSTSVQFFVATQNGEELCSEFQKCLEILLTIYNNFKLKYRIVKHPPCSYKSWESLRMSIQVFSPFIGSFIEVGHLSLIDDYISKRLRMCYDDKKGELFLKVVSGTVVNVQTLLALCLERSENNLFIPESLRQYFDL